MYNLNQMICFVLAGMIVLSMFSCEDEEECPTCNEPPSIEFQQFQIPENSPVGTIVDTVRAMDADPGQAIGFKLIGGNVNDAFAIGSKTGILTVKTAESIDYETNPEFELIVEVKDSCDNPLSATNKVVVNLIDIKPTEDGLISYYPFDGNTNDVIGPNDGTGNDVVFIQGPGIIDKQFLLFNGSSSYVDLSNPFDLEVKTISIWFNNLKADTQYEIIYTSDNPNLDYGLTILATKILDSKPRLCFYTSDQADTIDINENTWYNATIITDDKLFFFYLDGELVKTGESNNFVTSWNGFETAFLGCIRTMDLRFFNGMIDEVRIYDRHLSEDEVRVLYSEGMD